MKTQLTKLLLTLLLFFSLTFVFAQNKRILFLGNSYTSYNNLPQILQYISLSTFDTVITDSHAPGGYRFLNHTTDSNTINKIQLGNWDYVILQEQSQFPSFPEHQVQNSVYPYASQLNNLIKEHNSCAQTIFYMTWGRKYGDDQNCAGWPAVCTYEGMDDLIRLRYETMANQNQALVSPVGVVWRALRESYPNIELYQSDNSHPTYAGSYAAACAMYSVIFRKDPTQITYNGQLSTETGNIIRQVTKEIVFDNLLQWNVGAYDPTSEFTFEQNNNTFSFTNNATNTTNYFWNFGDGNFSDEPNPTHTYLENGTYTVTLRTSNCEIYSENTQTITINNLNIDNFDLKKLILYPNPTSNNLTVLLPNAYIDREIYVFDTSGRKIKSKEIENLENSLDLSDLPSGIYFISTDKTIKNYKIVKH